MSIKGGVVMYWILYVGNIILNNSGERIYVTDRRLMDRKYRKQKSKRVLCDSVQIDSIRQLNRNTRYNEGKRHSPTGAWGPCVTCGCRSISAHGVGAAQCSDLSSPHQASLGWGQARDELGESRSPEPGDQPLHQTKSSGRHTPRTRRLRGSVSVSPVRCHVSDND